MPETFVPLSRPGSIAKDNGFAPLPLKILSPTAAQPAPKPACEPAVTLQRDGDKITSIHIECSCGQVIDLACEY